MALAKALIIDKDSGRSVPVMFNPPEYQVQRTNQFVEIGIPGLGESPLQFVRGSAETLTMSLFFDTSDQQSDVRVFTDAVVRLTEINSRTGGPPRLLFIWGSLIFPCILESISRSFTLFNAVGMPLRAELNVTFKGHNLLNDTLGKFPSQYVEHAKQRVVKAGDSLQRIAAEESDDPARWRPIAEANDIDNPLTIPVGQQLIIPALR